MTNIGIITGNLQENKTGMGTYMSHLIRGIVKTIPVSQIHHKDGDCVPGCTSVQPWYPPIPYWYLSWSRCLALSRNRNSHCDLIHNIGQYPVPIAGTRKNIITIHDLIPILYPSYVTPVYALQSKLFLPEMLRNASAIITVSESTKQDIIRHFRIEPDKIHPIHHGVSDHFSRRSGSEVQEFKNKYGLHHPFILFVGALEPKKNIPMLVKAFGQCLDEYPSLELVIAGKKFWKFEEIFTTIGDLHLEKKVRILDFVPYDDLPLLYNAASAFVFPSRYEGFGFPPLEAMKCGTPVIVSNRSSLPEVVGPGGITVDPSDEYALRRKILDIITDPDYAAKQSEYGLMHAASFTWENCVKKTLDTYYQVLNE